MTQRSPLRRLSDPLIGPEATSGELALGWGVALGACALQLGWALMASGWSPLQIVVAAFFAFDIGGGLVVNATGAGRRWWHRPALGPGRRYAFFAIHVHPFLLAWVWPQVGIAAAAALYFGMLALAALVMAVPTALQRPVATGGLGLALAAVAIGFDAPVGLQWFAPLFFVKLIGAHAVPPAADAAPSPR